MVTVKDIAMICKVSPATVSKALNGYEDVNAQTAERIRQTARKLNYLPNAAARQLKTNISNNIGVLFYSHSSYDVNDYNSECKSRNCIHCPISFNERLEKCAALVGGIWFYGRGCRSRTT